MRNFLLFAQILQSSWTSSNVPLNARYENRERIDADIEAAKQDAAEMRTKAGPSRLQQKLRQNDPDHLTGRVEYL
jgi:hypothetical protein